jgi:hypothetical protein
MAKRAPAIAGTAYDRRDRFRAPAERSREKRTTMQKKDWSDPELILDQWYKYEQIAMHFNDLLLRFRSQALGGLTALGTLAAVFISAKGVAAMYQPVFFGALLILWVAAWILDTGYYSLLLKGAVADLRALEKRTEVAGVRQINLSTRIDGLTPHWRYRVHAFYGLVSCALAVVVILTLREGRSSSTEAAHSVAMPVTFTVDVVPAGSAAK